MLEAEKWMDIKDLHRNGMSRRQIALVTGHSRNTIARVLAETVPAAFSGRERTSCLDPYKEYVRERFDNTHLSAARLFEEICAQGYTGSPDTIERFLRPLKQAERTREQATVRFETAPGQQAQADWAYVGEQQGQKIYAFLIVLSFCRAFHLDITRSMQTPQLIICHQNAFSYFGGVPSCVLFDNQAQVRLPNGQLNPLFADFACHYGFTPKTHRPYRPRTKGKVERLVDYMRDNFLRGREFADYEDLCQQGRAWQEQANSRVHATTGKRPCDLLEVEREKLLALSEVRPYVLTERFERKVDVEGFVQVAGTRYSVPPEQVGRRVVVAHAGQQITVRCNGVIVAEHTKGAPGMSVVQSEHAAAMWRHTLKRTSAPEANAQFGDAHAVDTPSLCAYDRFCGEVIQEGSMQ